MLQLHLSDQQFNCLLKCVLYYRLDGSQYHSCWCPGSLHYQDISRYGIDYVQQMSPCPPWGRISTTSASDLAHKGAQWHHMVSWTSVNIGTCNTEIILRTRPANGRRRYNVTSSLIGWAHSQNDPWPLPKPMLSHLISSIVLYHSHDSLKDNISINAHESNYYNVFENSLFKI